MNSYDEFETQRALHYVCTADNPKEALERFQDHVELLGDWRIMYAAAEPGGTFGLVREQFSKKGFISTMLRGKSTWLLDKAFALSRSQVDYTLGGSLFLDSNAASYIRKISYAENISPELDSVRADLQRTFSVADLARLNSYIYLCEAQKSWSPKTRQFCKETVAAVHALSLDENPLSDGWGKRFRAHHRDRAEAFAEEWIEGFSRSMEAGLSTAIAQQSAAAECMILRAKIIECSSSASPEAKMEELLSFMHNELHIFMLRELIVCADILFHTKKTKLSEKLNSILDQKEPLRIISNCAWDLFILRIIESLSNPRHLDGVDFCLDHLITFDEDLVDIICLTELRAVAVHLGSHRAFPFFDSDLIGWLTSLIGHKRMADFSGSFHEDAFTQRADLRSLENIQRILAEDRLRLLQLANK